MKNFVFVSDKPWHDRVFVNLQSRIKGKWHRFKTKDEFNPEFLSSLQPEYIFIPHWSYIIPAEIYDTFTCIVFHMTDLPYGRGGSPLQNLIVRGHKQTMISAIKVEEGIDTGDIYLKSALDLFGTAREIFMRSASVIEEMIVKIVQEKIVPQPQAGEPVIFKRRKPADGNLADIADLQKVFDFIRMLDCEGYPNAFLETENFRFEFTRASLRSDEIINADVRIIKK